MELPEIDLVSDLIREPGMDDEKLALIASAFPVAFPSPLPTIGTVPEALPEVGLDNGLANRLIKRLKNKALNQPSKKKRKGLQHANGRGSSGEPTPKPGEEEYDPNQPLFTAKPESQLDPSRFDTDLTRRKSSTPAPAPWSHGLSFETLKALKALQIAQGSAPPPPPQPVAHGRASRSPSVGRGASCGVNGTAPAANGSALPAQMPDLSGILAALQGGPQAAATTAPSRAASTYQPSQTPVQPYNPYTQRIPPPSPGVMHAGMQRPSSRYVSAGGYHGSAEPAPAPRFDPHDLQAALARNNQHFAANAHPGYAQAAPAYNPPPAGRSPPRFTYVYDDDPAYAAPPAQHGYRYEGQPAPSHYAPQPAPYQYAPQQQPETIYVDQYGRPVQLIPVDAAPPPQVQYQQYYYPPQQEPQAYGGYYQQPPPQ